MWSIFATLLLYFGWVIASDTRHCMSHHQKGIFMKVFLVALLIICLQNTTSSVSPIQIFDKKNCIKDARSTTESTLPIQHIFNSTYWVISCKHKLQGHPREVPMTMPLVFWHQLSPPCSTRLPSGWDGRTDGGVSRGPRGPKNWLPLSHLIPYLKVFWRQREDKGRFHSFDNMLVRNLFLGILELLQSNIYI